MVLHLWCMTMLKRWQISRQKKHGTISKEKCQPKWIAKQAPYRNETTSRQLNKCRAAAPTQVQRVQVSGWQSVHQISQYSTGSPGIDIPFSMISVGFCTATRYVPFTLSLDQVCDILGRFFVWISTSETQSLANCLNFLTQFWPSI